MATVALGDISIDYEECGAPQHPTVLLVMGLGAQRITWPPEMIEALTQRGLHVVTFDNRDAGLSTVLDDQPVGGASIAKALRGEPFETAYSLAHMAADAVGLLDHLGVDSAHVVGVSMGGMIAQHLAISHAARVASLTSIMSSTGSRDVGQATPEATAVLYSTPPTERAAFIEDWVTKRRIIGSPRWFDEARARDLAGRLFDRGLHPAGTARQLMAIYADGDRTQRLAGVRAPTLVIHGDRDPLIGVSGGRATADAVPGSTLLIIEDMGHDLPLPVIPSIVEAIGDHIAAVEDAEDAA